MQIGRLVSGVRRRLDDMQALRFSDYELREAIRDAHAMLWIALAENFSSLPRKTVHILPGVGGVSPLPEDFYNLVELPSGVTVTAFSLEGVGEEGIDLVYNCIPSRSSDDDVNVPESLALDMIEISSALASGDTGSAAAIAVSSAKRVSQGHEFAAIPNTRPFP